MMKILFNINQRAVIINVSSMHVLSQMKHVFSEIIEFDNFI